MGRVLALQLSVSMVGWEQVSPPILSNQSSEGDTLTLDPFTGPTGMERVLSMCKGPML